MSKLDNDGGPQVIVIDEGCGVSTQALWVRVGPVYHGSEIAEKPGVWIEYQPRYMKSLLQGSVLIDPETWDELDKAVRERIAKFNKSNYGSRRQSDVK